MYNNNRVHNLILIEGRRPFTVDKTLIDSRALFSIDRDYCNLRSSRHDVSRTQFLFVGDLCRYNEIFRDFSDEEWR